MQDRYWQAWTGHCKLFPLNDRGPNHPPHNIEDMLLTFAVAVQDGKTAAEIVSKFSLSQSRSVPSPNSMFWTDIVTPVVHPQHNIHSSCPLLDS